MTEPALPTCSWVGEDPSNEEIEIPCGKPATYYLETADGRRVYTCLEHLSHAKMEAPTGHVVHEIPVHRHDAPSVRSAIRIE